jgi:glutamate-1-semialdehyde 2,1-aminomutase
MGLCLPQHGFLQGLRDMSRSSGVILIFDEVITGLRVGPGGAQAAYGVHPDLTCIGKALGGGLPIAAFGGRADIMSMLAPIGPVFVGGTFSGNPACVAAAHALLDALAADPSWYQKLDKLARQLAAGLERVISANRLGYPVVQYASMVDFMFRSCEAHRTMKQAREADAAAYARYYRAMLEHGILLPPSQMELMFLTGAHTLADIDQTLAAASQTLAVE